MKLTRIESRETFPVPERAHYRMKLGKGGGITFYLEGREMKFEEMAGILSRYMEALNRAEDQLNALHKVIYEAEVHNDYMEEYLEDYSEEEDYASNYKVEDIKDALFHAMMKKDEKEIGRRLNELNIVTEKLSKSR